MQCRLLKPDLVTLSKYGLVSFQSGRYLYMEQSVKETNEEWFSKTLVWSKKTQNQTEGTALTTTDVENSHMNTLILQKLAQLLITIGHQFRAVFQNLLCPLSYTVHQKCSKYSSNFLRMHQHGLSEFWKTWVGKLPFK